MGSRETPLILLTIPYQTDEELDRIIYEAILGEAHRIADLRTGCIAADIISLDAPDGRGNHDGNTFLRFSGSAS
jgi:hypothetical protein